MCIKIGYVPDLKWTLPLYFLCVAALLRGSCILDLRASRHDCKYLQWRRPRGKSSLLSHILCTKVICQHGETPFSFFPVVVMVSSWHVVSQYALVHCLEAKPSTSEDLEPVGKLRIKSFDVGKQLWCIAPLLSVFLNCSTPYNVFNPGSVNSKSKVKTSPGLRICLS